MPSKELEAVPGKLAEEGPSSAQDQAGGKPAEVLVRPAALTVESDVLKVEGAKDSAAGVEDAAAGVKKVEQPAPSSPVKAEGVVAAAGTAEQKLPPSPTKAVLSPTAAKDIVADIEDVPTLHSPTKAAAEAKDLPATEVLEAALVRNAEEVKTADVLEKQPSTDNLSNLSTNVSERSIARDVARQFLSSVYHKAGSRDLS